MKTIIKVLAIALLVVTAGFTTSCLEDSTDPITIKIISEGANTTSSIGGFIIADDNIPFTISDTYTSGNIHYYQITLDDIENLYVNANITDGADASVSIIIYRRTNGTDVKVKETTTTIYNGGTRSVVLTYEYDEETSSTSSDDSSSSSSSNN